MPEPTSNKPQQPKPVAKPASPRQSGELGIDPVMAELVKSSAQATAKACPQCKSFLQPNAVICTTCGYNLQTGKTMGTQVVREKAPKDTASKAASPKRAYAGFEFLDALPSWVYLVGPTVLVGVPFVLSYTLKSEPLLLAAIGLYVLNFLAFWIWSIMSGFRNSVSWGLGMIFLPIIPLGGLIVLWYIFNVQDDEDMKYGWGGMLLLGLVWALLNFTVGMQAASQAAGG